MPWLGHKLAEPVSGAATVVFHSVVMQYMNKAARAAVAQAIADAGNRATNEAARRVAAHGTRLGRGPRRTSR